MKIFQIILVLVLSIYSIINIPKLKRKNWKTRIFTLLSLLAAFVISWNGIKDFNKQQLLEKINSSYGELVNTKESTVPMVKIGDTKAAFIIKGTGVFNFPPYTNLFKVFVKDNRLYLNMIVRDRGGNIIAAIYENVWTMYDNSYEYNDDENAFEIVTRGDRKVFFHMELKEGAAHIEGFLFSENCYGLYFHPSKSIIGVDGAFADQIRPGELVSITYNIQRIFKYPRAKYYGIRETD